MKGDLTSYMTAPLSEYVGSHIYQILGIDVHETILGVRNNKLVVACKDFCKNGGELYEIRTLKNVYNEELSKILEASFSSTSSSHFVDIDELLTHFEYNPGLKNISGIKERFWELFVIDILINNNDRNDGNWGLLYENGQYKLAPVFDNGASFSNKLSDSKIEEFLSDEQKLKNSALNTTTIFKIGENNVNARDILNMKYPGFYEAIKKIVPVIQEKMNDIKEFILKIPTAYNDMIVCSDVRKNFYIKSMELRLNNYLLETLKKINTTERYKVKQPQEKIKEQKKSEKVVKLDKEKEGAIL